jgi:ElaB/YqjD/DUF883 family membrane-anchored ribosome-binding protein
MADIMAEPIRRPEPLPNQQPETSESFVPDQTQVQPILDPERELPSRGTSGRPMGKVVEWRRVAGEKLEQAKESAAEIAEQAATRASVVYAEAGQSISRAYEGGKDRAEKMVRHARQRATFYAENYPLQVIAVAAGAGFVVGALLRVWRSRRYE